MTCSLLQRDTYQTNQWFSSHIYLMKLQQQHIKWDGNITCDKLKRMGKEACLHDLCESSVLTFALYNQAT